MSSTAGVELLGAKLGRPHRCGCHACSCGLHWPHHFAYQVLHLSVWKCSIIAIPLLSTQTSGWSQSTPSCSSGSPTTWDLRSFFPQLGFSTSWPTTAAGTMYLICFVIFFLCISSWKLHASTFQNFSDSSWYSRFWRFYARIFSSCSLGKKIHNKNYVRRLCLSGTMVPRWTRLWSQPSPPTHLQELEIEVWFRICEISFFNRDSNSLQEPQHTPSSNLCSQRNAVSSDSYSISAKKIMPIAKCLFLGN